MSHAIASLTAEEILKKIRYDKESKRGSVLDVIQLVTGCGQNNTSRNLHSVLDKFPDINHKLIDVKFPGERQKPTKAAPLPVLVEIAWLCPGRNAKEFRRTGAQTLCRALGGDLSLVDEIRQRHAEIAGTDEQAALLAGTGVSVAEANGQALAPAPREDPVERRLRLERYKAETSRIQLELAEQSLKMAAAYRAASAQETDERQRLFLDDTAKNVQRLYAPGGGQQAILEDGSGGPNPNEPITLSGVAAGMGFRNLSRGDLQALGKQVAKLYREEHGEGPPKHTQFVDGAARQVSSYFEKDRALIERAVRALFQ